MDSVVGLLQDYLNRAVDAPEHASLDLQKLPEEWQTFGFDLVHFTQCVAETAALAKAIAKGNLSTALPPPTNEMAAPLKALHASLRHLTWQTQQIVKGDYQQRVDFMGEFSEAFNAMTTQLECRRAALLEEIEIGRRKTKALEQSNSLFEVIAGKIAQWIIVADGATCHWLYANQQAADALYNPAYAPKLHLWMKQQINALAGSGQPYVTELELRQGDAGVQYFSVEIHPLSWYEHNALVFMLTDISAEKERLCLLQDAAYIDMPTRLFNRNYAMHVLNEWLEEGREFILCFADMDNLKYVNDRFGHCEGDRYILAVAQQLTRFSREMVLCRVGGDEFLILAQSWSSDKAHERMETLRFELMARDATADNDYDRSISYGIIEIGAGNLLSAQDLLNIADEKMYDYKRRYKMRCQEQRKYEAGGAPR